jgi:hypothetical protein
VSVEGPEARHLTADADWAVIAEWCGGTVVIEEGERLILTGIGGARAGTWIVATPGGPFSHAVYSDRDYRGLMALMARRGDADTVLSRRDLVARVMAGMEAAGTGASAADLAVLADTAVRVVLPGLDAEAG